MNKTFMARFPKVNGYDVEDLGLSLRLKLVLKNVPYEVLDMLISPNEECTIREMLQTLERYLSA